MFAEYLESAYQDAIEKWGSALESAEFFAKERERLILENSSRPFFPPMPPLKRKVGRPRKIRGQYIGGLLGLLSEFIPEEVNKSPRRRGRPREYNENIELWHKVIMRVKKLEPCMSRREIVKKLLVGMKGVAEPQTVGYIQRRLSDYKNQLKKSQDAFSERKTTGTTTTEIRNGITKRVHHGSNSISS